MGVRVGLTHFTLPKFAPPSCHHCVEDQLTGKKAHIFGIVTLMLQSGVNRPRPGHI